MLISLRRKIRLAGSFIFALLVGLFSVSQVQAISFGLKTCGSNSPGFCGGGIIAGSLPPTHLFTFEEDGSTFVDVGAVKVGGSDIDSDGLAYSSTLGLFGFQLHKSGTTTTGASLISINATTATATTVGSLLDGRDIRGAVFDVNDHLYALDASANALLRVDPTTGNLIGTGISLALGGNPFDVSDVSDLAVDRNGSYWLADIASIYSLNIVTGELTLMHSDPTVQLSGITYSDVGMQDILYGYDVGDFDDILSYDTALGFSSAMLYPDIIPAFNAGRGDLASQAPSMSSIPEPSTWLLFFSGIFAVARYKRLNRLL